MKRPIFECDNCGERHGHRTEMYEVPLRWSSDIWTAPRTETLHVCLDCDLLEDVTGARASISDVTDVYDAFLVDSGEVVGLWADGEVTLRKDLSVEDHGNVAIIRDAMDAVEVLV